MPATSQPFPDGAEIRIGYCGGAFCRDDRRAAEVVPCMVGPTYREAMALELCADCLADFAVVNDAIPADVKVVAVDFPGGRAEVHDVPRFRVFARSSRDGLYHEVTGNMP